MLLVMAAIMLSVDIIIVGQMVVRTLGGDLGSVGALIGEQLVVVA